MDFKRLISLSTCALLTFLSFSSTSFSKSDPVLTDAEVVLSEEESRALDQMIPKAYKVLLNDETIKNPYFYGDESRIVEYSVTRGERLADVGSLVRLGDFDPRKGLWFFLPHLEIPLSEFQHLNVSATLSPEMKKLYFFTKNGEPHVRYFLHPFRELEHYRELIKKYDLKYDYLARPISSPRSMIVIKNGKPESPSWVKVSLGLTMSALQRRQKPEKLARALMVNEALEMIPPEERKKLQLDWMSESFAAQLPGKEEVIIGRDTRTLDEIEEVPRRIRPTFSFFHSPDGETLPDIAKLIEKSGLSEVEFFKKYFLTPAIRTFIHLAFEEGIQWSMHTGNYYTEVNSKGLPTGKLIIKDFDGAAFDHEMRMLRGKPFHGIHRMSENPFADAWFAAATGRGTQERQRLGYVFSLYIRDVYGFNSIASYMFSYLYQWGSMQNRDKAEVRKLVESAIDEITADEIHKLTGIKATGLGKGVGTKAGINVAYNTWRDLNHQQFRREDGSKHDQKLLKTEFLRLLKLNRAWTSFSKANLDEAKRRLQNDNVVLIYHEGAGMIQARSYAGKTSENYTIIGYAMIEDPQQSERQKKFLKDMKSKPPSKTCSGLFEPSAA